jgi:hypothetical protein
MKPLIKSIARISNTTKQHYRFFPITMGENIIFGKIIYRVYNYFDFTGHGHSDDGLKKGITGHLVVNNNNAFRPDVGHPCFQYLTVDKPAVNSHQSYIQIFRQVEPPLVGAEGSL